MFDLLLISLGKGAIFSIKGKIRHEKPKNELLLNHSKFQFIKILDQN